MPLVGPRHKQLGGCISHITTTHVFPPKNVLARASKMKNRSLCSFLILPPMFEVTFLLQYFYYHATSNAGDILCRQPASPFNTIVDISLHLHFPTLSSITGPEIKIHERNCKNELCWHSDNTRSWFLKYSLKCNRDNQASNQNQGSSARIGEMGSKENSLKEESTQKIKTCLKMRMYAISTHHKCVCCASMQQGEI